jgi:hypothetical protein
MHETNNIITPYIRILDFDWLMAGVFSYLGLISFIFTAVGEKWRMSTV